MPFKVKPGHTLKFGIITGMGGLKKETKKGPKREKEKFDWASLYTFFPEIGLFEKVHELCGRNSVSERCSRHNFDGNKAENIAKKL